MLALALFLCGLFCCRCWPAGGDVTEVTEVTEVTDHPSRALEESLLRGAGRGQLPPALRLRQQGQQGPEAASGANAKEAPVRAQRAQRAQRARTWLLTQEGVPCNLPFWYEGQKYEGCHPEGWCCLDERCARTGTCSDLSQTSLPLLLPRDVPETGCQLETLDRRPFERLPGARPEDDKNLVFFILREGEEVEDEDLGSLLTVLSSIDMSMVLMSYATPAAEAEKAVRALEQSILRMLTNSSAEEVASVLQKLYLVPEPAQALSYYSCWLPAVIQARSKDKEVLVLQADTGDTGGKAELATTVAPGTRGGWASSLKPDLMGPELPVRWAGFLCGQDPKPEWPPAASDLSGFVALVARGDCSFYQKVQRAQAQGAIAVIIFSQDETPGMMGCAAPDPCDETLSISAVMTGLHVGQLLLESMFPANVSGADSEGQVPQVLARFTTQRQGPSMVGLLGHGGGLWYDSFPGFGRAAAELRGMEFRRQLLSHRQEVAQLTLGGDSLRVPVFEEEFMPGSITQKWTAEHAALVRQGSYDELEIELRLDCPDHLDENCPPWDHELNLFVCTEGRSERPVDCDGSDDTIARWITPYGREGHWITKAPAAIPLLTSPEALKSSASLRLATWQKYTVSLVFWFRRRAGAGRAGSALAPLERLPLWSGGAFNPSYNPAHDPISFHMPARAHRVVLSTLITGHGWGVDEANCAEFCNHVHHFAVNGVASPLLVKDHPEASTSDGCQRQVAQGVVPNQYGTWPFGRAGWCPGKDVDWWEVDITEWVVADALNNITYRALFNGTDYEPVPSEDSNDLGFPAEIHLVSALVFYGDSPETTSAQQLASQESQAPERIVLP